MIKVKNKKLGTLYLDEEEETRRIKLLDSNKKYIGYINSEMNSIEWLEDYLYSATDIYDIEDLGFCNIMTTGSRIKDIIKNYCNYKKIETYQDKNIKKYINKIGNTYLLVDYREI